MKKLVFMFVAMAAMSFASCGNNQPKAEVVEDTVAVDTLAADTLAADTAAADTTVAE